MCVYTWGGWGWPDRLSVLSTGAEKLMKHMCVIVYVYTRRESERLRERERARANN